MELDVRRSLGEGGALDVARGQSTNSSSYLVAWPSNDGREDSTGGVISGKSSLDQARAVVTHKGGSLVVVTHGYDLLAWSGIM